MSVDGYSGTRTRVSCSTLVPHTLLGSADTEFVYDPACNTLSATMVLCCEYPDGGHDSCALSGAKP